MRMSRLACGLQGLVCIALAAVGLACLASAGEVAGGKTVTIKPRETNELLANPGMGWQTFHHFADDDPNLDGLPSGAAYFRFYWRELEPREGQIDFAKLDDLLAHAHRAGQKLSFRVMCASTSEYFGVPEWLKEKGCRGFEYEYDGAGPFWVPDFDDPIFQEAHFRLLRELGKRYDGHPDLDHVDIGSVGLWGEWHMSGTGVDVPPLGTRLAIIDAYLKAFPTTPLLMQIGDTEGMRYAISKGCGWRADCLGDMGGFSPTWNHMENAYPQQVEASGAQDAWKRAPVAWETCWDMRKWVAEGWDVCHIFQYALDYHGSYVNNKSAPIPKGTRDSVEGLLRKLGYRLVLRMLEHPQRAAVGSALAVRTEWENVGVAPPYHDYRLAFRLSGDGGEAFRVVTAESIKGWLPGSRTLEQRINLPADLAPGRYTLSLGVVDPRTGEPGVRLAIEGRDAQGWYPLSGIEITPAG
jgi:hypothetical protein